jgi:tetratricopeptide (TPR) repeat protein
MEPMPGQPLVPSLTVTFLSLFAPFLHPSYLALAAIALFFVLLLIRNELPFWMAQKSLIRGDYDHALRRLELLERLHHRSAAVLYLKGTVLMFAGRNQEAEEAFRQCLAKSQLHPQKSVAMVNLGYVLLEQGRYEDAARSLDEAIKIRPKGAVAYSTRAEVYLRQGIEPQKALDLLDRGIEYKQVSDQQSNVDRHVFGYLHANRAWALFLLGHPVEAEEALAEALKFAPGESKPGAAGIHYHVARALLAGRQESQAMEHFRQACEIDPDGKYAALSQSALREHRG